LKEKLKLPAGPVKKANCLHQRQTKISIIIKCLN